MNENEKIVYNCIKKHKPARNADICELTKLTPAKVHYALKVLVASGQVGFVPSRYEVRK